MDKKIKDMLDEYYYKNKDNKIRKYTDQYYPKKAKQGKLNFMDIYHKIKSKKDVEDIITWIKYFINKYEYPKYSEDIIDIEDSLAKYEIAIKKMLSQYTITNNKQFDYSPEELQKLIDDYFTYCKSLEEIRLRYLCRD